MTLSLDIASNKEDLNKLLFGTGLTKRIVKTQVKQQETQQTKQSQVIQIIKKPSASALTTKLPNTLIDDSITLDESQTLALDGILTNKFACLIGAAGTGKTTTIKSVISQLVAKNENIILCAYTGRAVQQIKRALPIKLHQYCDTIHGLLEYAPEFMDKQDDNGNWYSTRQFIPHRTNVNKMSQTVIVIDEAGMLSIDLWHKILDALKEGARVYFIGDINQLPPVHGRSVLGFAMKKWPTFELNRNHRTSENAIINGAWDILHGRTPQSFEDKVLLKRISDNSIEAFKQVVSVIQKLSEGNVFNPVTDGIITPQNEDTLGQQTFNERLCAYFNQPIKDDNGVVLNARTMVTSGNTHHAWAVGDKVMVTQNDREAGLTNGMIGIIESITPNAKFQGDTMDEMATKFTQSNIQFDLTDIDELLPTLSGEIPDEERERQSSHVVAVKFQNLDQPISFTTAGTVNTLTHAYAFTCHKAQGGEYPVVVIVCHSANFRLLCREWLYTAWTRAQAKVILLYNSRGLQMALNNQKIKGNTIAEKANSFNKLQERNSAGEEGIIIPELPKPEGIKNEPHTAKNNHIHNEKPIKL